MIGAILGHAGHAATLIHAHPEILLASALVALIGLAYRALRKGTQT